MIDGLHVSVAFQPPRAHLCGRSRRSCRGRRLRSRQSVTCSRALVREAVARVCVDQPEQVGKDAATDLSTQFCEDAATDRPTHLCEGAAQDLQVELCEDASIDAPLQFGEDAVLDPPEQFCKKAAVDPPLCEDGTMDSCPPQVCEDVAADLPVKPCEDAAAAAAAAFLRRIAPPSPPGADAAAAAAAAFLQRIESRNTADAAGTCGMEPLRRKRLNADLPAADRRSRRRVRFDLAGVQAHEVVPYEEIYGLHPREFVFGRGFRMIPAGGDYGFVDFLTASRRAEGAGSEDIEDSDASSSDQSDDCHDDSDIGDEDFL